MYLLAPFILQNFKRIFRAGPELSGCDIFGHKMGHLSWTIFFFANHYYYFHLPSAYFIVQNLQKLLRPIHFWDQNGPFAPNNFLEN